MSSPAADRAYVAAVCDNAADALDRARARMDQMVNELRDEWSSNVAHQVAASEARTRQLQEDHVAWLRSRATGEPAPPQNVAQQAPLGASPTGDRLAAPVAEPAGRHIDPRSAELAEAERIRGLSMSDYLAERAERGIGNPASSRGLFSN